MKLDRVMNLFSADFKYSANFGAFGGRAELVVWDNDNTNSGPRRPIMKTLFTPTSLYQLKAILKKAIATEDLKPVELGFYPYDKETKTNVFRSAITVGRDQEKCIYMDLTGENHKEPVRFLLITDKSIRINGSELPNKHATEISTHTLIDLIDHVLQLGSFFTSNRGGNDMATSAPSELAAKENMGDDVPF